MMETKGFHRPVMVDEVVKYLLARRDGDFVDATAGGGSHSYEIISRLEGSGRLLAVDRDAEAISVTRDKLKEFGSRSVIKQGEFGHLKELAERAGFHRISGILFDLGVSSHQLDSARRGFSYLQEGQLDLRMDAGGGLTAAEIINRYPVGELADILFEFGGEKNSRKIARAIGAARSKKPLTTTLELAEVVKSVTNPRYVNKTLSRVYLSLRTVVNDELNQLRDGLEAALSLLESGGRLVVIAYHSLEDRIVKNFFRDEARGDAPSSKVLTKKPLFPTDWEIRENSRARSARMRVLERL